MRSSNKICDSNSNGISNTTTSTVIVLVVILVLIIVVKVLVINSKNSRARGWIPLRLERAPEEYEKAIKDSSML